MNYQEQHLAPVILRLTNGYSTVEIALFLYIHCPGFTILELRVKKIKSPDYFVISNTVNLQM